MSGDVDLHDVLGGCLKQASSPARLAGYLLSGQWPCGCPLTTEETREAMREVTDYAGPLTRGEPDLAQNITWNRKARRRAARRSGK